MGIFADDFIRFVMNTNQTLQNVIKIPYKNLKNVLENFIIKSVQNGYWKPKEQKNL